MKSIAEIYRACSEGIGDTPPEFMITVCLNCGGCVSVTRDGMACDGCEEPRTMYDSEAAS